MKTTAAIEPPFQFGPKRSCRGRVCYSLDEAAARAVMSERCPRCGWFHILREIHQPEAHLAQLKTRG